MSDLISRQAAIEAVGYYSLHSGDKLLFADKPLRELPSAQPEIVRCKDCSAYGEMLTERDTRMICHKFALNFPRDFYCADAERRTDE